MINRLELTQENILLWYDCNGAQIELGQLSNCEIKENCLLINGECYPIDSQFYSEREIIEAWDELYPNGKPVEVVEPELKVITEDEKAQDLLKVIALNIMNNDELLKTFGIEPRPTETTT